MKRFRFTLLAVCLVLLWLGSTDIRLFLNNRAPAPIPLEHLERQPPEQVWLQVTGGFLDLERAISTSGTLELEALLVPLTASPQAGRFSVLVETRDPQLLELFRHYHFGLDSAAEQRRFLEERRQDFHPPREVTGMVVTGLVATGNRDKLMKIARSVGMDVPETVLFLSEGKEPPVYRGFFFAAMALLGLWRLVARWKAGQDRGKMSEPTVPAQE